MPKHLTAADQKKVYDLFHHYNRTKKEIIAVTGFSGRQVRRAILPPVEKKKPGRRPLLSSSDEEELIAFVTASKEHRRMTYSCLAKEVFHGRFGMWAIRSALVRNGFKRHVAAKKPFISETNRQKRLTWALEHRDWTAAQWNSILWSDETWVTNWKHRKIYVTRRADEELDQTCVLERDRKPIGWLFWGCFSGDGGRGPGLFWQKDWGTVTSETYQENVLPLVDGWIREQEAQNGHAVIFMQDGAPGHSAQATTLNMNDRGIQSVRWPPYSPDLNPIERCWEWLKCRVDEHIVDDRRVPYQTLRGWVEEAWEALPEAFWRRELDLMPQKMQAVIDANGMHTKY